MLKMRAYWEFTYKTWAYQVYTRESIFQAPILDLKKLQDVYKQANNL